MKNNISIRALLCRPPIFTSLPNTLYSTHCPSILLFSFFELPQPTATQTWSRVSGWEFETIFFIELFTLTTSKVFDIFTKPFEVSKITWTPTEVSNCFHKIPISWLLVQKLTISFKKIMQMIKSTSIICNMIAKANFIIYRIFYIYKIINFGQIINGNELWENNLKS